MEMYLIKSDILFSPKKFNALLKDEEDGAKEYEHLMNGCKDEKHRKMFREMMEDEKKHHKMVTQIKGEMRKSILVSPSNTDMETVLVKAKGGKGTPKAYNVAIIRGKAVQRGIAKPEKQKQTPTHRYGTKYVIGDKTIDPVTGRKHYTGDLELVGVDAIGDPKVKKALKQMTDVQEAIWSTEKKLNDLLGSMGGLQDQYKGVFHKFEQYGFKMGKYVISMAHRFASAPVSADQLLEAVQKNKKLSDEVKGILVKIRDKAGEASFSMQTEKIRITKGKLKKANVPVDAPVEYQSKETNFDKAMRELDMLIADLGKKVVEYIENLESSLS